MILRASRKPCKANFFSCPSFERKFWIISSTRWLADGGTKIHPIKTTLKKAIDYICNGDKTDDEIYVTTYLCSRENAHKEFELTKKQFNSRTKTLAHHLIQSFVPEEVSSHEAHQVGIELCEKILGGEYEYVFGDTY